MGADRRRRLVGFAALGIEPFRRRLRPGLSGWAVTMAMLDWHLGMLETPDGRPRNLGAADAATLLRAWLVPAVADDPSPLINAVGFATDVLDGQLARASEPTRLGRTWRSRRRRVQRPLRGASAGEQSAALRRLVRPSGSGSASGAR